MQVQGGPTGLGGQEGQEGLGALQVSSFQGYPQLRPDQGSLGWGADDLLDLSFPLGPRCQGLPWGQWAREAPGHQLHPLKGAEEASLAPGSPQRPPSPGLPWAAGEPQGGAGSSEGQRESGAVSPASLASSTFRRSSVPTLGCR